MIKDNIEIVTKPNKGRSVIAKSDILAGQNIIQELPIVCIPYPHSTISGLSVTSGTFKYSDAEKELKIATVATKFNGSLCMLAARYFIHSLKDHDTDRYNMIRNHVDISILNSDNSIMESLKECAKIMLQLIKRSCRGVANASLELCIYIIYRLSCNVFTIVNEFFNDCGLGVYPLAAMINHSCIPNCIQHFSDEGVITIRTMRNIKAGEEITISYIDIAMPTWLRRKELLKSYYFHCNCDRCIIDVTNDILNEGYQCYVCSSNNLNGICHLISSDLQLNIYKMWISGDNKLANNCSMSLFNKKLPYDLPLPYFNLLCSQITTATTDYNYKQHQSNGTILVEKEKEGDDDDDGIRFQCNLCKHIYNSKRICETIRKSLNEIEMSMNKSKEKSNDYLSNEIIRFHSIYNSLKYLVPSESSYCMLLIRKRLKLAFELSLPIEDGVLLFPSNISYKYNVVNNGMDIQRLYEINLKKLMKAMVAACYPDSGINICSLFCTIQYVWYIASKHNLYNDSYSLSVYSNKCNNNLVVIANDRKTDLHTLFHLLPNILDQISIIYSKTHPFYYSMTDIFIAIKTLF